MNPYLQNSSKSTLDYWEEIFDNNNFPSFGLFAYITESGIFKLQTKLSQAFNNRDCKWIIGFDYGRSQPNAIRQLSEFGNSQIRIYDAEYVLNSVGFVPRKSYHLKTTLTCGEDSSPIQQIISSSNLSATGLQEGIEAGSLVTYEYLDDVCSTNMTNSLQNLWNNAIPFENVIDEYERKYNKEFKPIISQITENETSRDIFWIEVGYVTKNRGETRAGNQFDLPRGAHVNMGLPEIINPERNSLLGSLNIRTPTLEMVERNLRFGNNQMEKLTLPIPEDYGYDCYDGKILTFEKKDDDIILNALEHNDFYRIYDNKIIESTTMQSGRRYGKIRIT